MTDPTRRTLLRGAGLAALALALSSCARDEPRFLTTDITGVDWGHDFQLVDHHGRPRTLSDFRGKVVMLFFGFTHCPDICPTTLASMARAVDLLGKDGRRTQGLFVTLDPARDTPDILARYVPAFHPDFLGLRGSEDDVARIAADFKIFYSAQPPDESGFYTVDHMAAIFVFDALGHLRLYMKGDTTAEVIAHDLELLLAS